MAKLPYPTQYFLRSLNPTQVMALEDFLRHYQSAYHDAVTDLRKIKPEHRTKMVENQLTYWENGISHIRFLIEQIKQITKTKDETNN